ncbi:hypothetical protein ABB37_02078 [Leptomonas pyrrhocoris]|uniref:Uncharacterized protein n=1 Tax=Leptomonas pyrrhocoris TaxID=157538 RepID=A0A0N0DYA4_LEPPY|nr:hypothetical protein ABB37_02078 [Leptomonas pyrrhocoris]XP_015662332.1 hypothetical protein ABB37_02078 [Leptomonas pyrrhocoris]XP_015662333.1 hypothetical protein ABB37_02078 [Leptomonas pyrrhocoris]KPA83892.1 hypothetical protein ABB37_02078 [Leptomonas pyrrhocoris]KPA83893.1 hypothetical protein ABB37_02078 [Leptomonas pyrrhocoris]KPA83894.1 hypothetical protein ABB37_02078 [Leptomonas pyrrhocoris]|eukprot:XP_015662331.1 hypothetical protein ABB37_02078 [Leptomonas pyrrhocoris]
MPSTESMLREAEAALFHAAQVSFRSVQAVYPEQYRVSLVFDAAQEQELCLSLDQADLLRVVEACEVNAARLRDLTAQLHKEWVIVSSLSTTPHLADRRCTSAHLVFLETQLSALIAIHATAAQAQAQSLEKHQRELDNLRALFDEACSSYGVVQEAVVSAAKECARLHRRGQAQRSVTAWDATPPATSSAEASTATRRAVLTQGLWDTYQHPTQIAPIPFLDDTTKNVPNEGNKTSANLASCNGVKGVSPGAVSRDMQSHAGRLLAPRLRRDDDRGAAVVDGGGQRAPQASSGDVASLEKDKHQSSPPPLFPNRDYSRDVPSNVEQRALLRRRVAKRDAVGCSAAQIDSSPSDTASLGRSDGRFVRKSPKVFAQTQTADDEMHNTRGSVRSRLPPSLPAFGKYSPSEFPHCADSLEPPLNQHVGYATPARSLGNDAEDEWRVRLGAIQAKLSRSLRQSRAKDVQHGCASVPPNPRAFSTAEPYCYASRLPMATAAEHTNNATASSLSPLASPRRKATLQVRFSPPSTTSDVRRRGELLRRNDCTNHAETHEGVALRLSLSVAGATRNAARSASSKHFQQSFIPHRHRQIVNAASLQHMSKQIRSAIANLLLDSDQRY